MNIIHESKKICLIAFLLIWNMVVSASDKTENDTLIKTGNIVGVPIIYYSPETGWASGGRLGYYWLRNQSSVYTNLFISQKLQFELFFGGEIYKEKWRIIPKFKVSKWVDKYYGLGNDCTEDKVLYNEKFIWALFSIQRRINSLYTGLELETRIEKMMDRLPEDPVGNGNWYILGGGFRFTYDKRNNIYYTTNGQFFEATLKAYPSIAEAYKCYRMIINYRYYKNMVKSIILASEVKFDLSNGNIPIQIIPSVGDVVRGYDKSRYRDNKALYGQTELKFHIWKRFYGAVFFGIGDVMNSIEDLSYEKIKIAAGSGLRFRLTEKGVNLRLDFAVNRESDFSMYLDIGEAF